MAGDSGKSGLRTALDLFFEAAARFTLWSGLAVAAATAREMLLYAVQWGLFVIFAAWAVVAVREEFLKDARRPVAMAVTLALLGAVTMVALAVHMLAPGASSFLFNGER